MRKIIVSAIVGIGMAIVAVPARSGEFDLQAAIDQANPGDLIQVPAGAYRGNYKLKEGVVLVGAGAGATVLDGNLMGPVIEGAPGAIVKGFAITRGIEGIKTNGNLMGIFDCVVRGNAGVGICTGGGDAVIVNNVICDNRGKAGIEAARSCILAANNTICGQAAGVMFWNTPNSKLFNTILALNEIGVLADEGSSPEVANNDFWANTRDFDPASVEGRNFYDLPYFKGIDARDFSLTEESRLRTMGIPVEGLPEDLTAGIGADLSREVELSTCRNLLEAAKVKRYASTTSIVYELSERLGSFLVTVKSWKPAFVITSSSDATAIDQVSAFDSLNDEDLLNRLNGGTPASVDIWGREGGIYPDQDGRYVMESVFSDAASFFQDEEGRINFIRRTNLGKIAVAIPEGCEVVSAAPEGSIDAEKRLVSFENPKGETIEISLVFS
ncbi:MAG: hypothetical protein NTV79_11535, partial [Candidatus Aureabacteria bacterium]|nr:hypothetical protein [Candidatus Auribacterota bacterium]